MKNWKELTTEELANLTDKQIEQYKKLICAENGIRMLQEPQEPVKSENLNKDCEVYAIPRTNLYFSDFNEAKEILASLKKMKSLGTVKYLSDREYFETGLIGYDDRPVDLIVSTELRYSKKKANEIEAEIEKYNQALNKYEQELREYCTNKEAINEAVKEFLSLYEESVEIMDKRKELVYLFYKEYLPLADNNTEIAMGFLKKAYAVSEEDEEYIKLHKPEN